MVGISVEGEQELAVCQRCAVGKLVSPSAEPAFEEGEGVVEDVGVGSSRALGFLDHLCPDQGAEAVPFVGRGVVVRLLFPLVQQGSISPDDVII